MEKHTQLPITTQ
jgi:hypothetical protein